MECNPTVRQRELMQHMASGLTPKEAAYKMGILPAVARNYLFRARTKLGYRTSWQLLFEMGKQWKEISQ
jgi:DNA-binding CsgD family transcriptional regulator